MLRIILSIIFAFFISSLVFAQDTIMISTDLEDISLTDDLGIARAQVEKYPDNVEAHFNLAIALSRTSKVEETIKELHITKKLIRKPENKNLIDKKIAEYVEILENHKDDVAFNNIRYRLAFSYYLKAYYLSKEIEKANKQNNKNDKKNLNLFSDVKLIKHDNNPLIRKSLEESKAWFDELLKINSSDEWAKVYYGFILAEQFYDVTAAMQLWDEVISNNPNNPAPYFFKGELKIKEGNLKDGIKEISQAVLLRYMGY